MKQEPINEPSANGGVYSIAYYRDDKWMLVDKEQATQVKIVEFNEDDNHVFRTYGRIKRAEH